jgi:hypothetical protein
MDFGTITGLTSATVQGVNALCDTGAVLLGLVLVGLAVWSRANQPCSKGHKEAYSIWAAAKQ